MPKNYKPTYGDLYRKLGELGFSQRAVEIQDKPSIVFQHKKNKTMIVLPQRNPDEAAENGDVSSVIANLRVHKYLPEQDPLAL